MVNPIGQSLRARLLFVVLVAVIPPLGLLGFMGLQLRAMAAGNTLDEAVRLGRIASAEHARIIGEIRQMLTTLAVLPEVRHPIGADCQDILATLRTTQPYIANFGVLDLGGDVVCSGLPFTPPVNAADRSYFQRTLASGDFAAGDYQLGRITHLYTINFGYPVRDDKGEIQSVVFAAVDLSWLNKLADEVELQEGSTLTVFDRNGTVLARHPSGVDWTGQSVPQTPLMQAIRLNSGAGTAQVIDLDRRDRLFAFTSLAGGGEGVVLAVGTSTDVAYASANRAVAGLLIGAGFIVILTVLTAWYGADAFALRRLRRLLEMTERLAAGDLTARVGPPYGPAELGRLSMAFDEMALELETRNALLERSEAEVERVMRAARTAIAWLGLLSDPLPPEEMLRQACEVAVGPRGYRAAWVWRADPSGRLVRRMAASGLSHMVFQSVEAEIDQGQETGSRDTRMKLLSQGTPAILRDLEGGAGAEAWIDEIASAGISSLAFLPLRPGAPSPSSLVLGDDDPDSFGDDEVQALAHATRVIGDAMGDAG